MEESSSTKYQFDNSRVNIDWVVFVDSVEALVENTNIDQISLQDMGKNLTSQVKFMIDKSIASHEWVNLSLKFEPWFKCLVKIS